jgi:hypothetical protein
VSINRINFLLIYVVEKQYEVMTMIIVVYMFSIILMMLISRILRKEVNIVKSQP